MDSTQKAVKNQEICEPLQGNLGITQSSGLDRHAVYARQRVDEFKNDNIASTQSARQAKDATDLVVESDRQYAQLIRRLTPLECERLQGFPDGWTNIPGASDSARYRALGNSVAILCGIHYEKPQRSCFARHVIRFILRRFFVASDE